ncbi:MAG TPA: NDP-sugar synthase [Vicinamibacterales bacterium]|jgi:mannose-1-phosphate guanylyltransferase
MRPRSALILAAGLGTRLRPLTELRAKPAMPLDDEPIVRRTLRQLAAASIDRIIINLHHRPETIAALVGDGSDLGVRVRYSWEQPVVLGSAGGPRLAVPLFEEDTFFIINGDTLSDIEFGALAATHAASGATVTMAVVPHPAPGRYGGLRLAPDDAVVGFSGPDPGADLWHFIGVQIASARAFASLTPGEPAETVRALYPALIAAEPGRVRAFRSEARFQDIGTPADYLETSLAIAREHGRDMPAPGRGVQIAPDAHVARSILWDEVVIGPRAHLTDCIVADGVTIPPGAHYSRAVIMRGEGELIVSPLDR